MNRTNADILIDRPPHLIREITPLFDWARSQAAEAAEAERKAEEVRAKHATVQKTVEESGEFGEVENITEAIKARKEELLADDPTLEELKASKKKARAELKRVEAYRVAERLKKDAKALDLVATDTRRGIQTALVTGNIPSPLVEDSPRDGKAAAAK